MTLTVHVLCRPAVAAGFRLAGLPASEADGPDAATVRLAELLDRPDTGVVLVEDALHDVLPPAQQALVSRRTRPVVVPFPSPSWEAPEEVPEARVMELLRQAIGYRVRLR